MSIDQYVRSRRTWLDTLLLNTIHLPIVAILALGVHLFVLSFDPLQYHLQADRMLGIYGSAFLVLFAVFLICKVGIYNQRTKKFVKEFEDQQNENVLNSLLNIPHNP